MGFQAGNIQTPSGEIPKGVSVLPQNQQGVELSKQEIEFLLTLVKNSTFKGEMIEIVYKTVYKLQDHYTKINK
jgi:hypothetical protein